MVKRYSTVWTHCCHYHQRNQNTVKKNKLGNATCSDVVGRLEAAGGREEGRKVALGAQRGHAHALRLQVLERLLDVQDRLDLIHIEQNKKPSPSLTSPSPSPTHSTAHHRSH